MKAMHRFWCLALVTVVSLAGCSEEITKAPSGDIRFESASLSATSVIAGQGIDVAASLLAETEKHNTVVSLQLAPLSHSSVDPQAIDLNSPALGALLMGSTSVDFIGAGGTAFINEEIELPTDLAAGAYAVIVSINLYDSTASDDHLQSESEAQRANNRLVLPDALIVTAPLGPDLILQRFEAHSSSFSLFQSGLPDAAEDASAEGDEVEGTVDFRVNVEVEAELQSVDQDILVTFQMGLPDGAGGTTWYDLSVVDRSSEATGHSLLTEYTIDAHATSGDALTILDSSATHPTTEAEEDTRGESIGFHADLVMPDEARDALLATSDDTLVLLRAHVDAAGAIDEHLDLHTDNNTSTIELVHFGDGIDRDALSAAENAALSAGAGVSDGLEGIRISERSPVLSGSRLDRNVAYPHVGYHPSRGETWGDSSKVSLGYNLESVLSYGAASVNAAPIVNGDTIAIDSLPSQVGSYLSATNGGGGALTILGSRIQSHESFHLEIVSTLGPGRYSIRLRGSDGTHYVREDTSNTGVHFLACDAASQAAAATLTLVDVNGGNLLEGDTIRLEASGHLAHTTACGVLSTYVSPTIISLGLGSLWQGNADFRIVRAQVNARKGKAYAGGDVNVSVLGHSYSLASVKAASEFDSEDIAGTYFDYEVKTFGVRVFGKFYGVERNDDDLVVATIFDAGDRFTKSVSKSASTRVWLGPVPIKITVGATGSVGIKAEVAVESNNLLSAQAGPYFSVVGTAGASLDGVVASVGVYGDVTLIEIDALVRGELQFYSEGNLFRAGLYGPLTLTTMDGRLYIRVSWDLLVSSGSKDWDIVSWKGYSKTWNWFTPLEFTWE